MLLPPDRDHAGVGDAAVGVEEEVGRAAADVDDGDADFFLVLAEHRLGAGERLEHDVGHGEAAALDAADRRSARSERRRGDQVDAHLEAHAAHADRVADAVLVVDHVLARQRVEDHAVGVDRDGARAFEHALEVGARDLARRRWRATPSEHLARMWLPATPA